jgi:hypothetical protein
MIASKAKPKVTRTPLITSGDTPCHPAINKLFSPQAGLRLLVAIFDGDHGQTEGNKAAGG